MTTTLRTPVVKRCPFREEIDTGQLVITFPGEAPELHALGGQIAALEGREITHEAFTAAVAAVLPHGAVAVTTWNTGRFEVEVKEDGSALHRDPVVP